MSKQKEVITLSEEESNEVVKMMQENAKQAELSEEEKELNKKREAAQAEMKRAFLQMKKVLKPRGKNELIELIWNYGVNLQEMQRVAQILMEKVKDLEAELKTYKTVEEEPKPKKKKR